MNVKGTKFYRAYDQNLKVWKIENRPPKFVKHLVTRIQNCQEINADMVVRIDNFNFKVQSSKMSLFLVFGLQKFAI